MYMYMGTRTPEKDPAEVPVGSSSLRRENRRHDKQQASKGGEPPREAARERGAAKPSDRYTQRARHKQNAAMLPFAERSPEPPAKYPASAPRWGNPSVTGKARRKLPKRFASSEANRWG